MRSLLLARCSFSPGSPGAVPFPLTLKTVGIHSTLGTRSHEDTRRYVRGYAKTCYANQNEAQKQLEP
jgi:hypothetical protein